MPRSRLSRTHLRLVSGLVLSVAGIGASLFMAAYRRADALEAPPGPGIEAMRFRSGVTVLVASQPSLPSFTATVHYRVGSANEGQGLFGAAELCAAMLLDGTDRIGTRNDKLEASLLDQLDQLDAPLHRKLEATRIMDPVRAIPVRMEIAALRDRQQTLLAQLEANTFPQLYAALYQERGASVPDIQVSATSVQYTLTVPSDQLSYFLAMEGAHLAGSSSRNFYQVRNRLEARRSREQKLPGFVLLRGLAAEAFHVHAFGRYQADAASIDSIDRGDLERFKARHFRPSQTIIALAGGVRGADVRALADRYLSGLPPGPQPALLEPVEPPQHGERRIEVEADGPAEVLIAVHRDAVGMRAGDPLLPVLLELLGDPVEGPLAPLQEQGLVDRIIATEYPASPPVGNLYPSLFVVGARAAGSTTPEQLEMALRGALASFRAGGPTTVSLEAARKRARARIAEIMGEPDRLAPALARAFATLEDETVLSQLFVRVGDVRLEQVKGAAEKLFNDEQYTVGVLRPPRAAGDTAGTGGPSTPGQAAPPASRSGAQLGLEGTGEATPPASRSGALLGLEGKGEATPADGSDAAGSGGAAVKLGGSDAAGSAATAGAAASGILSGAAGEAATSGASPGSTAKGGARGGAVSRNGGGGH